MKAFLLLTVLLPLAAAASEPLPVDLPPGLVAEVAAAPPLVQHPIMATLGGPGQLFVGDAAGLNLNRVELEKQLPNRVLLLTDTNGDGVYDKVSVFADKMTFPQGGVFLEGSLYVASPPGIWRLTDTDGDGVADRREMIAGSFDFTGNAADVHGPFLHPNGRLYWCHGRKGHDVRQRDGTPVHAGLASGIWSCRPDGSDIRWHALGCGDNPVEIDFTPEGEIVGTQNLFFTNPRGDTIVHWLRGGVYPREDQLKAIAGLPRTLDVMPVVHNFGHSGVSGVSFYRSGALNPDWRGHLFVAHFNTQRVTRMEMERRGASYRVAEREFFKLRQPDAHLTDVLEDRDGSVLVVDTGGWFRIGCPSSLMAKPDVAGGIYRVKRAAGPVKVEPWGAATAPVWELAKKGDAASLAKLLASDDVSVARAAGNALATLAPPETAPALEATLAHRDPGVQLAAAHALGELPALAPPAVKALLARLSGEVDPAVEHQAMFALIHANQTAPLLEALAQTSQPALQRRALMILEQLPKPPLGAEQVLPLLDATDGALAQKAADIVAKHPEWMAATAPYFAHWLHEETCGAARLALLDRAIRPELAEPPIRELVSTLLESGAPERQRTGWSLLASAPVKDPEARWSAALDTALGRATPGDLPLVLDALAKNGGAAAQDALRKFSLEEKQARPLRLKALGASLKAGTPLSPESFTLLQRVLADPAAGAARIEAARILAKAKLTSDQFPIVAGTFATLGPLELRELVKAVRQAKDAAGATVFAQALKDAPALGALQESEVRTLFSSYPPEIFAIVAPALQSLAAEDEVRRRKLDYLPALAAQKGRRDEGRKLFETGHGGCIGCHRIGEVGNLVGPNLSQIGQIRTERDLLESILFPSATLARDYEAQNIDLADGQSLIGVIRRNLPDAIVIADATGQERTLPRAQIVAMQASPSSLMPSGLDRTLTEQELLDLVAFLRSRR